MSILLCILLVYLIFGIAYARKFEGLREFAGCHLMTISVFIVAVFSVDQRAKNTIIFCVLIATAYNIYLVVKYSKKTK